VKIAMLEDDHQQALLVKGWLEEAGHQVTHHNNGSDFLQACRSEPHDLAILDWELPDQSGIDVLDTLRHQYKQSLPVLFATQRDNEEDVVEALSAGADDYLTKPVNPVLLKARITACLERKRWHDREQAYLDELEKSYDFIRNVFGRYLSDEIVHQLLDESDGLTLGGGKQKVTIMMTDLRGFTSISQELPPEDSVRLLNNYLGPMTEIIMHYKGTVDEFIGDAILAIFGAPLAREDDTDRAIACALAMQQAMDGINEKNRLEGLPEIAMGIGLNTGEVVVGNIGSEKRSKYGIVGHHVNLAARVESFTVGGQVLASEYTVADSGVELTIDQSMEVDAKGIKTPIKIHQITGIGGAFDLHLNNEPLQFKALNPPLEIQYSVLSGKALSEELNDAWLCHLAEDVVMLQSTIALELMSNLRIRVAIEHADDDNDSFEIYGKVTSSRGVVNERQIYELTLTSLPLAARDYFLARVE